jgi:hypothetical protein
MILDMVIPALILEIETGFYSIGYAMAAGFSIHTDTLH